MRNFSLFLDFLSFPRPFGPFRAAAAAVLVVVVVAVSVSPSLLSFSFVCLLLLFSASAPLLLMRSALLLDFTIRIETSFQKRLSAPSCAGGGAPLFLFFFSFPSREQLFRVEMMILSVSEIMARNLLGEKGGRRLKREKEKTMGTMPTLQQDTVLVSGLLFPSLPFHLQNLSLR